MKDALTEKFYEWDNSSDYSLHYYEPALDSCAAAAAGNHPNKCRSCHGCTVDNKCDTCSQWTDKVWAGIVERSQARLNRKCRVVSETQASDNPPTTLKPESTER